MAERLKRAAAWLGLVTDDRYADYDEHSDHELTEGISREELVGHATSGQARASAAGAPSTPPASGQPSGPHPASVTTLETKRPGPPAAASQPTPSTSRAADLSRIITVHPRTYNEARTIGEHFRDGVPVIMNLSDMEDVDAKRLVDFAAGLIFGLRGTIERVTSKVFLLSPQNVNVTAEDKERIAGGFFNQS
ncbi:MAG: cell division inhibitor SepF [Actinomycetota bacterium]|nr:cell division inhibitor SepF [Actinomycetota bacterium]